MTAKVFQDDLVRTGPMTIAALMVYVGNDDHAAACVDLACDIAAAFDAALIGLSANMPKPVVVDPYAAGAFAGELLTAERGVAEQDLQRARNLFNAIAGARGRILEWRDGIAFPADLLVREARAADLLIIGRDVARASRYHAPDAGDVLLGAGRPLLLVPRKAPRSPLGTAVVVAWKESREARRAVADAMPFLRQASRVSVVEVCGAEDADMAQHHLADVVAFLARHGVAAEAEVRPQHGCTADQLMAVAKEKQAGLIVLGGYGHSRLRESAFGGVTRDMLKTCPVCLLLSH
jgi:nucleotide-binding universal stress UspA family protein